MATAVMAMAMVRPWSPSDIGTAFDCSAEARSHHARACSWPRSDGAAAAAPTPFELSGHRLPLRRPPSRRPRRRAHRRRADRGTILLVRQEPAPQQPLSFRASQLCRSAKCWEELSPVGGLDGPVALLGHGFDVESVELRVLLGQDVHRELAVAPLLLLPAQTYAATAGSAGTCEGVRECWRTRREGLRRPAPAVGPRAG